ncbi:hypothetical protein C8J56DRAFT_222548 [Mycena floridula]|nr:hypothetical protein C8J56DRAFT_222548 [Mycena floridula]
MSLWSQTIFDSSPFLTYDPAPVSLDNLDLTTGWYATYSGLYNTQPASSGVGDSLHRTAKIGASVNLNFYGSGISLAGATNCTIGVTIDGQDMTVSPSGNLLFSKSDLPVQNHSLTLKIISAGPDDFLDFAKADITFPLSGQKQLESKFIDNSDTAVSYSSDWTVASAKNIPNTTTPTPFHTSTKNGDTVSLTFQNASAIAVNGAANWGSWLYSVTLDGKSAVYNSSTFWLVPDALLFYQAGLDETVPHTIQLTNMAANSFQGKFVLNSFTVYGNFESNSTTTSTFQPSSTPPSSTSSSGTLPPNSKTSHTNAGLIAGVVVGVLLVLALFGGFFIFWCRRRKSTRDDDEKIYRTDPVYLPNSTPIQSPIPTSPRSFREKRARLAASTLRTVTPQSSSFTAPGSGRISYLSNTPSASRADLVEHHDETINRIVELVAQRIDPGARGHESATEPPAYGGP